MKKNSLAPLALTIITVMAIIKDLLVHNTFEEGTHLVFGIKLLDAFPIQVGSQLGYHNGVSVGSTQYLLRGSANGADQIGVRECR